jgi:hypothetical protein
MNADYWLKHWKSRPGRSGAEKRRARKGGRAKGPGMRGAFRQPIRSRRGYLDPFITERGALERRRREAAA